MKCPHCNGKGYKPGFDDAPGDSRFIWCSSCSARGDVADPTGGVGGISLKTCPRRILCDLFGCWLDEGGYSCGRCGAVLYEGFISPGRLDPIRERWWRLKGWAWPRCHHCGVRLWPWRKWAPGFCSEKCQTDWLPF